MSASQSASRSTGRRATVDRESLLALLGPVVSGAGCDLEDVVEQRAGSRRLLRVVVDRDGGVSDDAVTAVSRAISAALDEVDIYGDTPYFLEVTSPGVDRPLTEPRHWRRAAGRLVEVSLTGAAGAGAGAGTSAGAGGTLLGRVRDADESGATLVIDTEPVRIEYSRVTKAKMRIEFNRPAADGESEDGTEDLDDAALDGGEDDLYAESDDDGADES